MSKLFFILCIFLSLFSSAQDKDVFGFKDHPSGATVGSRILWTGAGAAENYITYSISYKITENDLLSKGIAFGVTFLTASLIHRKNTCHFAAMGILGNGIAGMTVTPKIAIKFDKIGTLFRKKSV